MLHHVFLLRVPEVLTEGRALLRVPLGRLLDEGGPGGDAHLTVHEDLHLGPVDEGRLTLDGGQDQLPPPEVLLLKLVRTPGLFECQM